MFSQSLAREPASARAATQRFMSFLELEAERGQLSRTVQKKVLDVMMSALTDTLSDHPELLQAREGLALNPPNRMMRQFLETSAIEPSASRAILAAYKDELLKAHLCTNSLSRETKMFSQSLAREPASARAATQRFMSFLELEAERGQLSRTVQKKVLDVMMSALTDTLSDHPELLQAREGLALNPPNRMMRQFLETSAIEPSASRAILAAYKDELLKAHLCTNSLSRETKVYNHIKYIRQKAIHSLLGPELSQLRRTEYLLKVEQRQSF